jgi:4'-phosphopantetheinyl transferase
VTGLGLAAIRVEHAPSGRPTVVGAEGLHVSVSRTRGAVAAAVAVGSPIGVDLEALRPMPALRLARRWLTEAEYRWIGGLDESERVGGFLWLWTQKEAIGKARGLGLRDGGMRQPIALPECWPPETDTTVDARWVVSGAPDIVNAAWSLPSDLMLAVACSFSDRPTSTAIPLSPPDAADL